LEEAQRFRGVATSGGPEWPQKSRNSLFIPCLTSRSFDDDQPSSSAFAIVARIISGVALRRSLINSLPRPSSQRASLDISAFCVVEDALDWWECRTSQPRPSPARTGGARNPAEQGVRRGRCHIFSEPMLQRETCRPLESRRWRLSASFPKATTRCHLVLLAVSVAIREARLGGYVQIRHALA